jgi:hypothetical protein
VEGQVFFPFLCEMVARDITHWRRSVAGEI